MQCADLNALEVRCQDLLHKGLEKFDWQWDDYTEMALTHVTKQDRKKVQKTLEDEFSQCWTYRKVKKAPVAMRDLVEDKGGLSRGQLFYCSNPDHEVLLVGAWWPWADRKTTSLRLSLAPRMTDVTQDDLNFLMKKWLDLS
ncbi:MAG: hypothetical protein ACLFUS_15205 [Candidatus Sumerlaeia bacterium]